MPAITGPTGSRRPGTERESHAHALMVYLNDHLAGATAGVRLARRLADHQEDPARADELTAFAAQVHRDRAALLHLMRELDVPVRRYLLVAGRLGELFGRLKPNGRLLRQSEVRAVMELEAMLIGVQGKAALWRVLRRLPQAAAHGWGDRLDGLLVRAAEQQEWLERLRQEAAVRVMSGPAEQYGDGGSGR